MMDGVAAADFDMIDRFIARYHLDPAIAPEAMAIPPLELARMLVDMNVPRTDLVRLAHGLTPARLAEVVGHLSALWRSPSPTPRCARGARPATRRM